MSQQTFLSFGAPMIDLYCWPTPNGHKVPLMLEECGLEYRMIPVDIGKGAQFAAEFLAISPNNKIPAIVDRDLSTPLSVFESGAILIYLAEKTGKFLPKSGAPRATCLQWLFWQVGGLGPMAGQNHHFNQYAAEVVPYAIERYVQETTRLYGVLDRRLAQGEFVAGTHYSIADMACYPWVVPHQIQKQNLTDFPNIQRWFEAVAKRPATVRAYARCAELDSDKLITDA